VLNLKELRDMQDLKAASLKKTLAQQIVLQRHSKNIQQDELAYLADVSRGHMSNIETGRANPSVEILARIAVVLEVEVWELLKFDEGNG
jgi:transcriptional regulator with XRE-family HTH domain